MCGGLIHLNAAGARVRHLGAAMPSVPSPDSAQLAGAYRLRPGRRPAIVGERPVLEGRRLAALLRGLPAARAPNTCAAVFTLCAHAHRRTSEAAVAAAGFVREQDAAGLACEPGAPGRAREEDAAGLQLETARDHLRAVALDWPARAGLAPSLEWLRGSPLRLAGASPQEPQAARRILRAFGDWLGTAVLQRAPAEWLADCAQPAALHAWCEQHAEAFVPARMLRDWHGPATQHALPCAPLRIADAGQLRTLAAALAGGADFSQRPHWQGEPRETGPWSRQRHVQEAAPWWPHGHVQETGPGSRHGHARESGPSSQPHPAPARLPTTAWDRLAARWIELVELSCADAPLLRQGALQLVPGEAIAWCEMARGLLFHWVRLDPAGQVQDYRVLAPTEWNFHPQGTLARALEQLAPADTAAAAMLGAAFDACVPCSVASEEPGLEVAQVRAQAHR